MVASLANAVEEAEVVVLHHVLVLLFIYLLT